MFLSFFFVSPHLAFDLREHVLEHTFYDFLMGVFNEINFIFYISINIPLSMHIFDDEFKIGPQK